MSGSVDGTKTVCRRVTSLALNECHNPESLLEFTLAANEALNALYEDVRQCEGVFQSPVELECSLHQTEKTGIAVRASAVVKLNAFADVSRVVADVLMSDDFLSKFASAFANTPLPGSLDTLPAEKIDTSLL